MFTGIIESLGTITQLTEEGTNLHITVRSDISAKLKIDQSVAHDGVCLTVVELTEDTHTVTAIKETLDRTALHQWRVGDTINLERAMVSGARLDGHMVQGHVDSVGHCLGVKEVDGSWYYRFRYQPTTEHLLVDKGSICINGVSLTVVEPSDDTFSVAIIPYTHEHTNFSALTEGAPVNLEFDIIGKYIARHLVAYQAQLASH